MVLNKERVQEHFFKNFEHFSIRNFVEFLQN